MLDADVVIGALDGADRHHSASRKRFRGWERAETPRVLALVNLTEVLVGPSRSPALLRAARDAIAALGITIHRPTEAVAVDAARLRREHPISLPDGFALATARQIGARLATFDERLRRVAAEEGIGT